MPHLVPGINFLYFSPSASFQPLCLCPACSCSYHIFSLCQLTTLTIHNSLSFSPGSRPIFSQIFPTIDYLPASGLTPRTLSWTVSSEHLSLFGRPFVKRFIALCYRTVVPSFCNVGVLWPNGWTDQDETCQLARWYASALATLC